MAIPIEPDEGFNDDDFDAALTTATARELKIETRERTANGRKVIWEAQPGAQRLFLACPHFEALAHGNRGGGKTDALLMDFAQHVGQGLGEAWSGVLFRRTYPELVDVVAKSHRWFRQIFPQAQFVRAGADGMRWQFPAGEALRFRHMRVPDDYWHYHGHEIPWLGWEELTTWPDDRCYLAMISCCRSSTPGVPRKLRSTTNAYGVGHEWVKQRFKLHGNWRRPSIVDDARERDGSLAETRSALFLSLAENRVLLDVDPTYGQRVVSAATNDAMLAAWREGSWDIVAGGMFADVWSHEHNEIPRFAAIPTTWRIDRSFDWGSSAPFDVRWWAQSDGSDVRMADGSIRSTVRGDLHCIGEWYGWTGRANEGLRMQPAQIAAGIVEREIMRGWRDANGCRAHPGPADSSIYTVESGPSIATLMAQPVRIGGHVYRGVSWTRADKSPGSRKSGWELMRSMMRAGWQEPGKPREKPGLFVVAEDCPQFLRTVPSLARDERDLDDIDTDTEDHVADCVRYRCRAGVAGRKSVPVVGLW